jgi:hypothetical protein
MNEKLKKLIFDKLYSDLSSVEIIPYKNSVLFIDRENKYWYLDYQKSGILFWRYKFFTDFFSLFCMKEDEFQSIISEWVEEVLNCKVKTSNQVLLSLMFQVEEVLNCKVKTSKKIRF